MDITRWGAAVLLAATVAVGGCGSDKELEERQEQGRAAQKAYRPVQSEIVTLGQEIGTAVNAGAAKADAGAFEGFAERMKQHQQAVAGLDTPESEVEERDAFAAALGDAAGTLEDIAKAAEDKDEAATKSAIDELVQQSQAISKSRTAYEGAMRSLTGQG